jgi:heterodisulfide reductase subunit A-like polyferredoxin
MKENIIKIIEPEKELPVRMSVDVLVVGGGPAGIIAAQAAAEDGLKVALIESRSFLGGNMTIGIPILDFLGQKGNQIIKGLPQKFIV